MATAMILESRPFAGLEIGQTVRAVRLVTVDDLYAFCTATGNHNPLHLAHLDGDGDGAPEGQAPGGYLAALVSAILGTLLPGPGTTPVSVSYTFHAPAGAGEEVETQAELTALHGDGTASFAITIRRREGGEVVLTGEARVRPPARAGRVNAEDLPGLTVRRHRHFEALLARAAPLPAIPTAVVCPESEEALAGALRAWEATILVPLLVGDPARIRAVAEAIGADLSGIEIIEARDARDAAARAVALVHEGRAQAVMKGHLHTDDLLRPMVAREGGLRMGRRLTHVFVMDVPGLAHPLLLTDAAINIAPDLPTKVDIVQNAIDLARAIGIAVPRVGVLSAVETINPAIPSSIDAALLSKMAERGQITGGFVDGPLAMDNAVDMAAARIKGLRSEVAGRAEVLVVPGIDAGNMLAKQLTFIGHAEAAGLVMGAKVPVILNSRADSAMARLASAAVAAIFASWEG